uniref:Uncharacterized protein n=1 Tax=Arundo donax TaxID=35708 RepID=A0A0A9GUJ0_ARUDO
MQFPENLKANKIPDFRLLKTTTKHPPQNQMLILYTTKAATLTI